MDLKEFIVKPAEFCRWCGEAENKLTRLTDTDEGVPMAPDGYVIQTCSEHRRPVAEKVYALWGLADVEASWLDEIINPPAPEPESDGEATGEATPTTGEGFEEDDKPEGSQPADETSHNVASILGDLGDEEEKPDETEAATADIKTMEKALIPDDLSADGSSAWKKWRRENAKSKTGRANPDDLRRWSATLTPQEQSKFVKSWK